MSSLRWCSCGTTTCCSSATPPSAERRRPALVWDNVVEVIGSPAGVCSDLDGDGQAGYPDSG
jgi:hypothetical protein